MLGVRDRAGGPENARQGSWTRNRDGQELLGVLH